MRMIDAVLGIFLMASAGVASASELWMAGERHGTTTVASAVVRDAQQHDTLRYTVWYPAPAGSTETALTIGPPDAPLFDVGRSAMDAPIAGKRLPTLLLSHGNGGSARMMGWLGTALARAGYLVIAVDHPGNNGVDEMTLPGSVLSWLRADDLRAALAAVQADPVLGPHVDTDRLGVIGFSAGGYTALLAAGARPDLQRLLAFCRAHPDDGVCRPQQETATHTMDARVAAASSPALSPWISHANDSRAIPGVRAVFLLAPAIVQAFAFEQLSSLRQPVSIVLGEADTVAPPQRNGEAAQALIPGAALQRLPDVGHYDLLAACTAMGVQRLPELCSSSVPKAGTHAQAVDAAVRFFAEALR
ncbi:alpha/beta fold hydrolase [Stenotrophomonas maltophilia]|uniref:alpha/beta hydrolase family protein n=1 Tax=Stenotrophomonas TaxID=40323 RepID=UPI0013100A24|nr:MULTISPECIES: alpha/beta fold hydrolase [Stenotrophomonas]ELC7323623.1 alpha/beta hydrolase [Stenotrophomonas maltophilia]MBA0278620.1 alpha/beta fold hydrolase [Stenotrophomonas maltophilia]MBA0414047.1 alpha/beta fold hydrolase [Stenotrophomonas maltophilia]MBA0499344.1 alpha/beta fold hydrolase [Stenotrophomonas maltophilia]MBA0503990.1 alpha/beta fold hydrolase [Stenotrophomonas maltophilia]